LKSTPGHRIDLGYVMQDLQEIVRTYADGGEIFDEYEKYTHAAARGFGRPSTMGR